MMKTLQQLISEHQGEGLDEKEVLRLFSIVLSSKNSFKDYCRVTNVSIDDDDSVSITTEVLPHIDTELSHLSCEQVYMYYIGVLMYESLTGEHYSGYTNLLKNGVSYETDLLVTAMLDTSNGNIPSRKEALDEINLILDPDFQPKKKRFKIWIAAIILLIIAITIICCIIFFGKGNVEVEQSSNQSGQAEETYIEITSTVMPDVIGMTEEEAKKTLEGLGKPVEVETYASDKPAGQVLSSSPAPGGNLKDFEGNNFVLYVSAQKPNSTIPNVVGMTLEQASILLDALGITYEKYSIDTTNAENIVVQQEPGSGSELQHVVLWISTGKMPVPPISEGESRESAQSKLSEYGFSSKEKIVDTDKQYLDGLVVSVPQVGEILPSGSEITVNIGKYKEPPPTQTPTPTPPPSSSENNGQSSIVPVP